MTTQRKKIQLSMAKPNTRSAAADSSERCGETLAQHYMNIRQQSEQLCAPLRTEDYVIQSMPDASPAKWHLAHVTWFFEQFILLPHCAGYQAFDEQFAYLFNSYYVSMGDRYTRAERGLLSRPTVSQIMDYRQYVDTALSSWLLELSPHKLAEIETLITLGLNHEQQHQELLLMDIKHAFSLNPLYTAYQQTTLAETSPVETTWTQHPGGISQTGADPASGFCYDNETPRHQNLLSPFEICDQLVSNRDWLAFINDDGYQQHQLWLSDGWAWLDEQQVRAPLYWRQQNGEWYEFTLNGLQALNLDAPVCHISFYEAEAYATWANARLPTEFEWEAAAPAVLNEKAHTHPNNCDEWHSQVWQWTRSNYAPYPGFKPLPGAVGEYNGKFMNSQYVMRGSACITPPSHSRRTYRNFFYPHMRWQFAGLRLAREV